MAETIQTNIHPTAQLLTHDDNRQLPSADTHGIAPPNNQQREVSGSNVATTSGSAQPPSSIDTATDVSRDVKGTEFSEHGGGYQQQRGNHADSFTGDLGAGGLGLGFLGSDYLSLPGTDQLATTMDKRLQGKRALQEQGHDIELFLDRPTAFIKYARAPDGRKLVPPEHSLWRASSMECVNSRLAITVSDDTTHSACASRSDREETHIHYASVAKSPDGSGPKTATPTDSPSGPPIEHGDVHMKHLDDDSDDLYETLPELKGPTPVPPSSKSFGEKQEGSVMQDSRQMHQLQDQTEEIDNNSSGVFFSNHEPTPENSLTTVRFLLYANGLFLTSLNSKHQGQRHR